jgi:hypothetical protein
MRVINTLETDLLLYGECRCIVKNTPTEYCIQRLHPWCSVVEIEQAWNRHDCIYW